MACAQVEADKIVVKTIARHGAAIIAACFKVGFGAVTFSPFSGNADYLRWVLDSVTDTVRLVTTTDSADAANKIIAAAKALESVTSVRQEENIESWYLWKGELYHNPGL